MAKEWNEFRSKGGVLTRETLKTLLGNPDEVFGSRDSETLEAFARWLGNSILPGGKKRRGANNFEIIAGLRATDRPGPVREIVKSALIPRLFQRTPLQNEMSETGPYLAAPVDVESLEAAREIMALDRARFGVTCNSAFLTAVEAYVIGDVRTAYRDYAAMGRALRGGEFIGPHTIGALSVRSLEEFEQAVQAAPRHDSRLTLRTGTPFSLPGPVLLVGVDAGYHQKYAQRLVSSARGTINFHFHICNPVGVEFIEAENVRYSYEFKENPNAAYYASMRFLILRQILQTYGVTVVSMDADAVMTGERPWLFDMMEDLDMAIGTFSGIRGVMPWRYLNAQVVAANPTPQTERFLRYFEAQFELLMAQDGEVTWYVDQALLTSSLILARAHGFADRIAVLGLSYLSGARQSKV
jgi:hypothetical protein